MQSPAKFFAKKYLLTYLLSLLLLYFIFNQTFFASDFEKAKTAAARWPQLSKSHLQLSLTLFKTGSADYQEEFNLAKKSLFWNEKKFQSEFAILNQPQFLQEEIKQWETWLNKGVESPEIYLRLSFLEYQLYRDEEAKKYWQKADYLDPNNKIVEEMGKIINK